MSDVYKLIDTNIIRKAHSRGPSGWYDPDGLIGVDTELGTRYSNSANRELRLSFTITSANGGYTDLRVLIGTRDFKTFLKAMCDVDRAAALDSAASLLFQELATKDEEATERTPS